jgi:hypothetical protein
VSPLRKRMAIALSTFALLGALAPSALATPSPPTNGGNGGGSSGQCTGPAQDRPGNACQSGNK